MAAYKYIELADAVKDLYLSGYTKTGIAQKLGVEVNKVGYILYVQLKMHLHAPKKMKGENLIETMPRDQVIRVITLTNWRYSPREISEDLNLPYCRISRLVSEATKKQMIKKMV